jgi:Prohead core protein serine protease
MSKDQMLFVDSCSGGGFNMDLNESVTDKGLTRFRGKFQEAEAINKNKRIYPFEVLSENVKKLNECVKHRGLIGELDHPTDSIIHFEKASHVITKLWWEGNVLMGEGEILNTPHGKILRSLLNDGVRVGISSRGVGNGKVNENGVLVIGESYKLITFDAVADPSTFAAFQEKVTDKKDKKENVEISSAVEEIPAKNESSSIYNVNKEALIACLGTIIENSTNSLKRGLGS